MIQENHTDDASRQGVPSSGASQEQPSVAARVEPCEFERLLERAMQILSTRHQNALLKAKGI